MSKGDQKIDCYPWPAPTEDQKRMFDALGHDEQLKMIQDALAAGLESGTSTRDISEIITHIKDHSPKDGRT